MKRLRILMILMFVLVGIGTQAQNTGKNPFVGSTHDYTISRGIADPGSTLVWTVLDKDGNALAVPTDHYTMGPNGNATVSITWLQANAPSENYIVQLTETRVFTAAQQAAGAPASGCPTIRQIPVTVEANTFDVYADLVTGAHECATVNPSVVVDVADDGLNNNDVFGVTTREFVVTAVDAIGDWNFTYTLTHKNAGVDENIGDLAVKIGATDISTTGQTVNVTGGITTQTITVTYTTNDNRQDQDFDLVFTVTGATDSLGTSDGDATVGKTDDATYTVYAVPATTGITTD